MLFVGAPLLWSSLLLLLLSPPRGKQGRPDEPADPSAGPCDGAKEGPTYHVVLCCERDVKVKGMQASKILVRAM
jgi:hypothetical protein